MNENSSSHISSIVEVCRCPTCTSPNCSKKEAHILCNQCGKKFPINAHSVDFLDFQKPVNEDEESQRIFQRALENWGEDLHKDLELSFDYDKESGHHSSFYKFFAHKNKMNLGSVLDVGCGPGFDAQLNAKKNMNACFYGVDIGSNIPTISVRDNDIPNLHYLRGDALNLPLKNQTMDSVVSMGVFHHTPNPKKCVEEAFRVLKPGGCLCVYLYKNHEENFLKYTGIKIEKILLRLTSKLSVKTGKKLCYALSPFVLLFFSWPAQLLKKIPQTKNIGSVFPLHWGTTPTSIIDDLQDRLMSPINHRFSKKNVEDLLINCGFSRVEVITAAPGHYAYGEK